MKKAILLILSLPIFADNLITIKPCPQKGNGTCLTFLTVMKFCQEYNDTHAGFKKCSDMVAQTAVAKAPNLKKYIKERTAIETELRTNNRSPETQTIEIIQACMRSSANPRERGRCVMSQLAHKMSTENLKIIAIQEGKAIEAAKQMQKDSAGSGMRETFCQD